MFENMDISILLSSLSTLIALGALWVSYRLYVFTRIDTRRQKLADVRASLVKLKNHAEWVETNAQLLFESYPDIFNEKILESIKVTHKKMRLLNKEVQKCHQTIRDRDIGDVIVSTIELEHQLVNQERMVNILLIKCESGDSNEIKLERKLLHDAFKEVDLPFRLDEVI